MKSRDDIVEDLHALGVREGDTLMVHASLRKLGPVEGGPPGVIEALDRAVGRAGTLMMLVGSDPADGPFDRRTSPGQSDVGYLAEAFRVHPRTIVNDHPESRFAARGRGAAALIEDAPLNDYYGEGSPLDRLCRTGGRVLRLGADEPTVTAIHFAETLVDLPEKRRIRTEPRIMVEGEIRTVVVDRLDDEHGIVPWDGEDYFALILRAFLATGRSSEGRVGNAKSELFEARAIVEFAVEWMKRNLAK